MSQPVEVPSQQTETKPSSDLLRGPESGHRKCAQASVVVFIQNAPGGGAGLDTNP